MRAMARVFIGIGSNVGDRAGNCHGALLRISEAEGVMVFAASSLYETEPWGKTDQPGFINAAAGLETSLSPEALFELLKSIETAMGRVSAGKWGPRVIDLDILFYDEIVIKRPDLSIPHRHVHERAFVLVPLAEIIPGLIHPVLGRSVAELLEATGAAGVKPYRPDRPYREDD